jgi:type IV pilus assembly protein PilC
VRNLPVPKYQFCAASADGTVVNGIEKSATITAVRDRLLDRNLQPISIKEKKGLTQVEITPKKVKKRDLMHLCRQLAVFIRAGVSVLEALEVLSEETSDKLMGSALDGMRSSLESGARFSEAAALHPELFPGYSVEVLRSAELTGNLDEVLDQLATYLEREIETEQKVKSALAYPAIVMVLAVVVSVVLVVYVLPKFKTFFSSLHAKLPLPTRILLALANWIGHWGMYAGAASLALVVSLYALSRTPKGKEWKDKIVLKIPVIGSLIHTAIIERFCRLLASMTIAGVSLPEALAVTTAATTNTVFRRGLTEARAAMLRGEGLATPLADTGLFPAATRRMFAVGESTGNLDDQLQSAANYLDSELDYKIKRFTTIIEPAVIIAVGLIVGFVAIALVSAMYGIYNQVKVS